MEREIYMLYSAVTVKNIFGKISLKINGQELTWLRNPELA